MLPYNTDPLKEYVERTPSRTWLCRSLRSSGHTRQSQSMGETAVQDARSTDQALSQRMLILKRILTSICLYCPRVNCRCKAVSDTREVNLSLCVGQIFTSRCSRLCYGVDSGTSDYGLYAMILTEINPDLAVSQPA